MLCCHAEACLSRTLNAHSPFATLSRATLDAFARRYLHYLSLKTPDMAEQLYAKHETFRVQIGKLTQITQR